MSGLHPMKEIVKKQKMGFLSGFIQPAVQMTWS